MPKLHYKSFGSGPPLIILHGLFGMLDNWQTIAKRLSTDFLVFIVDQRDHGRSPHTKAFNYAILAEDIAEFMESEWIYKAHIAGHSMGGKTAMQLALQYPDLVDRLIVVDMGIKAYAGSHDTIFRALNSLDLTGAKRRQDLDAQLARHISDDGTRRFLMKNIARLPAGGFGLRANIPLLQANYAHITAAIETDEANPVETLFLRGGASPYVQDEDWPSILTVFPNAQLQTIDDAGHWVHAERTEETIDAFRKFLLNPLRSNP